MTKIAIRLAETRKKLTAVRKERHRDALGNTFFFARSVPPISDEEEVLEKACRELQTLRHLETLLEDVGLEGFEAPLKAYCEKL